MSEVHHGSALSDLTPVGIPDIIANTESLHRAALALKTAVEQINRVRGDIGQSAVRVNDLVNLGVISPEQVHLLNPGGSTYNRIGPAGLSPTVLGGGGDVGGAVNWGAITGTLSDQTDLQSALNGKANTSHIHDDRYFTEAEVTSLLGGKANSAHSHNSISVYDSRTMPGSSGVPTYFPAPNDTLLSTAVNVIFGYDGWPGSVWASSLVVKGWTSAYAAWSLTGIATTSTVDEWYLRSGINSAWGASRRVWHSGNFNPAAVDALTLGGYPVSTTDVNNSANQVVRTQGNGYCNFGWINTTSGTASNAQPARIYCSQDAYIRYMTAANFRTYMKTPQIFVQSATPSGQVTGALWVW